MSISATYYLKTGMLTVALLALSSCKKFITVELPGTETFPEHIFDSDVSANSAMIAIYAEMAGGSDRGMASGGSRSLCYLPVLSADELESYSHVNYLREFYDCALSPANTFNAEGLWAEAYRYIYAANALLEGLEGAGAVTAATRRQLEGEALFVRAFTYFYLVNLYGPVPLALTTDYKVNNALSRSPVAEVYDRIARDLEGAAERLPEQYPAAERIRPNRYAALVLLARVQLYRKKWPGAAAAADQVLASGFYVLDSLGGVFLKNSRETIWQLQPNTPGIGSWQGRIYILTALPGTGEERSATLSDTLLDSFEPGDGRRQHWVDSIAVSGTWYRFPYKYKTGTGTSTGQVLKEYSVVLRLAETYLIRAEARAMLGDFEGARADINAIRQRAGLPPVMAGTTAALQEAIARERRSELFTEWGHRWLDLKRTGLAGPVLSVVKGASWQDTDTLYPIPQSEITINGNLQQNKGY